MSTLRQCDFSSEWTILMTNIQNVVTTTTTTSFNNPIIYDKNTASSVTVSYVSAFQSGIVNLIQETSRTGIYSGDIVTISLTNNSAHFEYNSRIGTYATIVLNGFTYRVGNVGGYFVWDILGISYTFTYVGEVYTIEITGNVYAIIYDGLGSLNFSIEFVREASSSSVSSSSSSSIDSSSSSSSSQSSNSSSSTSGPAVLSVTWSSTAGSPNVTGDYSEISSGVYKLMGGSYYIWFDSTYNFWIITNSPTSDAWIGWYNAPFDPVNTLYTPGSGSEVISVNFI
jgi:hypothetical protein